MTMSVRKLERSEAELFLEAALRDGRATKQELAIKSIVVDHSLQSRVATDPEHVKHLASLEDLLEDQGQELRSVIVFCDPETKKHLLADGFHRVMARKAHRKPSIGAYVIDGTRADAVRYSVSANLENSKPTSREDRRKAVRMVFDDLDGLSMGDSEVGRMCGVGSGTTKKIRAEYCQEKGIPIPENVVVRYKGGKFRKIKYTKDHVKKNENLPFRPRVIEGRSVAYTSINGKQIYLGQVEDGARDRLVGIEVEEKHKKHVLSAPAHFREWAACRGVASKTTSESIWEPRGIALKNAVLVLCLCLDPNSIYQAIGRVRLLRLHTMPEGRMIVACHFDEASNMTRELIELARRDGVEFLTPEQIVEQFASAGPKADGPESAL
jgi:hypothetical protein